MSASSVLDPQSDLADGCSRSATDDYDDDSDLNSDAALLDSLREKDLNIEKDSSAAENGGITSFIPVEKKGKPQVERDAVNEIESCIGIRILNGRLTGTEFRLHVESLKITRLKCFDASILRDASHVSKKWTIAAVLIQRVEKLTRNGKKYRIWTLSDLAREANQVTVFLFGTACSSSVTKTLNTGAVVLIKNSTCSSNENDSGHSMALTVSNDEQIVHIGQSRDYGFCRSDHCKNVINISCTDFCSFHLGKEYSKSVNNRMCLQSTTAKANSKAMRMDSSGQNLSHGLFKVCGQNVYAIQSMNAKPIKKTQAPGALPIARKPMKRSDQLNGKFDGKGETTAVLADGTIVIDSSGAKSKKPKIDASNSRAATMANLLQKKVEAKGGVEVAAQTLSRGTRAFLSNYAGVNVDHEARKSSVQTHNALFRSISKSEEESKIRIRNERTKKKLVRLGADDPKVRIHFTPEEKKMLPNGKITSSFLLRDKEGFDQCNDAVISKTPIESKEKVALAQRNASRIGAVISFDEKVVAMRENERKSSLKAALMDKKMNNAQEANKRKLVAQLLQGSKKISHGLPSSLKSVPVSGNLKPVSLGSQLPRKNLKPLKSALPAGSGMVIRTDHKDIGKAFERKSLFAHAAEASEQERLSFKLKSLKASEHISNQRADVKEIKVKVYFCQECEKQFEEKLPRCVREFHEISTIESTKRFFRCLKPTCRAKTYTLGKKKCLKACTNCGGIRWEPASAYSDKTLGVWPEKEKPATSLNEGPATTFNRRS